MIKYSVIKYKFLRILVILVSSVYVRQKYEGLENIPKKGSCVLAGNHIHLCDPAIVMCATRRQIHFLAKSSLFKLPQSLLFNHIGQIVTNRDGKDVGGYNTAVDYLKKGEIVGVYPEGTRERGRGLLPFKMGAVRMAIDADSMIVPFVSIGEYRPFRKGLIVRFGKPYKPNKDPKKANEELRNIISKMLENK